MSDLDKLKQMFNEHPELPDWNEGNPPMRPHGSSWKNAPSYTIKNGVLVGLSFSNFKMSEIPKELFHFHHLEVLVLFFLPVKLIPKEVFEFTYLKKLAIQGIQTFDSIPPEIGNLKNLENLEFPNNRIRNLPPEIANLDSIRSIKLHDNKLNNLPSEIAMLQNLTTLDLRDNQFQIPNDIYNKFPQEQIRYILNLQQQGAIPLNEGKMILLGDGAAGKTALVERLIHDKFSGATDMTEGIDIQKWKIDDEVTLNIWDFGGQEIMRAMHQFFMTPRTLYVLVCTHRTDESDSQVEEWLRLIEAFGGNSPVLIVKSKVDQHDLNLDENRLKDLYPNIVDFFGTSAKENTGIDKLRNAIKDTLTHSELKHIKDEIPKNQLEVKKALLKTQQTENYIDLNKYYKICEDNKVTENIEQIDLLRLLNDLGIAFNYGNKENPATTNVLKPEWVTKGIYAIINNNDLFQKEGNVCLTDLKGILVPENSYRGKYNVIMGLMDQFDLCFSNGKDAYLVPDLLPKKQPYLGKQFDESLRLQYQYDLLPRSIMPQFICRMNKLAKQYWLHGVIVNKNQNDGLIKVNYEKNLVSIFVNGNKSTRRDLLDEIRKVFTILNDKIKGKDPEMLVPLPNQPDITVSYDLLIQAERAGDKKIRVKDAGMVEVKPLLDWVVDDEERAQFKNYHEKLRQELTSTKDNILNHFDQKEIDKKEEGLKNKNSIQQKIKNLELVIFPKNAQIIQFENQAKSYAANKRNIYFGILLIAVIVFIIVTVKYWGEWGEPISWAILLLISLLLYVSRNSISPWSKYERDFKTKKLLLMHEDNFNNQQYLNELKELEKLKAQLDKF